jgi:hypothetical protein
LVDAKGKKILDVGYDFPIRQLISVADWKILDLLPIRRKGRFMFLGVRWNNGATSKM